jgi:phage terminase large subunit GpA-like protein
MTATDGFSALDRKLRAGLLPDAPLWVDEWADAHMVIPAETGAAEPGRYRTDRTPFARAVMRALSPEHPARRVVVMGASQLLKTQVGLNWFCALIAGAAANAIWLQPTDALAKRVSTRFDKTVQAVPEVRKRVATRRSRDNRNTLDTKEFQGGTLWILTGRSASNLSEASARYVYADEVDRILRELKGEGDPISLLEKRQSTYGRKAKSYYTSSPTEEDASRIKELFDLGDQQHCYVPCPHCGTYQTLEWENLHHDLAAGRAWYVCSVSGCLIEEHHKPQMLAAHEWRAHATGDGETVSFTISYLYAPLGWDSWMKLAHEHAEARAAMESGSTEKMQVFYNTRLARPWSAVSARLKPDELQARAEAYPLGIAPAAALVVTAAVDVQGNRLEAQLVGWGRGQAGMECWIINTHIIFGDPTLPETWCALDAHITTPVRHASGALLPVQAVAVDSGDGDSTQEVYEFVRARKRRYIGGEVQRVIAVKGASKPNKPVLGSKPSRAEYNYRGKPVLGGCDIWLVGTDTAKDWIFNRLALENQTAIHTSTGLQIEFYEQLLAEAKVTKWIGGKRRRQYQLLRRGLRNEQLDMLVYNLGMAHLLGLHAYTAERWERLRSRMAQSDLLADLLVSAELPADSEPAGLDGGMYPGVPPTVPPVPLPPVTNGGIRLSNWARG